MCWPSIFSTLSFSGVEQHHRLCVRFEAVGLDDRLLKWAEEETLLVENAAWVLEKNQRYEIYRKQVPDCRADQRSHSPPRKSQRFSKFTNYSSINI